MTATQIPTAVRRAIALLSSHASVREVSQVSVDPKTGATSVHVAFDTNLPSDWRLEDRSPTGVRSRETVRFNFPLRYPWSPPDLSLRPDFNRDLPHMQPWLRHDCPVPCIYDGHLSELIHHQGISGIVQQTAIWLQKAGDGSLIDPEQGWEPVRRDSFRDWFVADAQGLRSVMDGTGGYQLRHFNYVKLTNGKVALSVYGHVHSPVKSLSDKDLPNLLDESASRNRPECHHGRSLALIVWPGGDSSGCTHECTTYAPETVVDLATLRERAALYGCQRGLDEAFVQLRQATERYPWLATFPLAIVLLVRRPFHLIGTRSNIEVCPYLTQLGLLSARQENKGLVRPAAHLHTISRSLLAEMAGGRKGSKGERWSLIGAGSLGSKLAIHLTRAGAGPDVVIDKATMMPHNAGRHALLPDTERRTSWMKPKAVALCDALRGLDQESRPIEEDACQIATRQTALWTPNSWALVNSTASLSVREALATSPDQCRVIETTLFGHGRIGLITVEGSGRNPSTTDLIAEFYAETRTDSALRSALGIGHDSLSRQMIGQGCSSFTMIMSDGRLSLFAAAMAEYLLKKQRDGLPDGGEILIGYLSDDELGLSWHILPIPPVAVVGASMADEQWTIHVHDRVRTRIIDDAARCAAIETGGVLMGRLSEATRIVHVVDVLDAPTDSERSESRFILGTKGLCRSIDEYCDATDGSLYCLGTWHTHPGGGAPSMKDRDTASAIALSSLRPALSLVYAPEGFHAYLADAATHTSSGA
ncbi:MAG: Mov34/MPN/PAD-1 family protein [Acidobacteria bacterium]|nr:Mov34/MPN/PAD-1 family protein [Acidobacteriota bacterium]